MRITREESKMLGRRQEQPVKADGDLLAIWVPGKLVNPLNAHAWGWQKRSRLARQWKDAVALAVLAVGYRPTLPDWPKTIRFIASTGNTMDSDGLWAALKPIRDGLIEACVIDDDAPKQCHDFIYEQKIDRKRRGVEIRVRLRDPYLTDDFAGGQGSDFGPPASTPGGGR